MAISTATESVLDVNLKKMSSPEPEFQRGRKRRRDLLEVRTSSESATFRGRCRHRSSSRYFDMSSRPTSSQQHRLLWDHSHHHHHRNTSASLSPARRKMLRVMQLAGNRPPRSRSPSRSRSPYSTSYMGIGAAVETMAHDTPKRRRQRTRSQGRAHTSMPIGFNMSSSHGDAINITAVESVAVPLTAVYEIVVPREISTVDKENSEQE